MAGATTLVIWRRRSRQRGGEGEGEAGRPLRVHQHPRALQVVRAMAPGREQEMAFQKGLAGPELGQDVIFLHLRRISV